MSDLVLWFLNHRLQASANFVLIGAHKGSAKSWLSSSRRSKEADNWSTSFSGLVVRSSGVGVGYGCMKYGA